MRGQIFLPVCLGLALVGCTWSGKKGSPGDQPSNSGMVAEKSPCRLGENSVDSIFDGKNEKIVKAISAERTDDRLVEVVELAERVKLTGEVSGCADGKGILRFEWVRVPDGGAGLSPMYRLANFLFNIPTSTASVMAAREKMAEEALKLSKEEDLGGASGNHDTVCGERKCQFTWQRASDGALTMTAVYQPVP